MGEGEDVVLWGSGRWRPLGEDVRAQEILEVGAGCGVARDDRLARDAQFAALDHAIGCLAKHDFSAVAVPVVSYDPLLPVPVVPAAMSYSWESVPRLCVYERGCPKRLARNRRADHTLIYASSDKFRK
jgi:hypothetical protein